MVSEDLVAKVVEETYKKALLNLPEDVHNALKMLGKKKQTP